MGKEGKYVRIVKVKDGVVSTDEMEGGGINDGVVVAAIVCTEEMKGGEILHRNKCPQLRCIFFVLKMKQYFMLL